MQSSDHTSSSISLLRWGSGEDGEEPQLEDAAGPSSGAANGRSKKSRFRGVTHASKDPTQVCGADSNPREKRAVPGPL